MTLPPECHQDLDALLSLLPEADRPSAVQVLRDLPYSAERVLKACRDGILDRWTLPTVLRRLSEDCPVKE
jgi:hypothetical protein